MDERDRAQKLDNLVAVPFLFYRGRQRGIPDWLRGGRRFCHRAVALCRGHCPVGDRPRAHRPEMAHDAALPQKKQVKKSISCPKLNQKRYLRAQTKNMKQCIVGLGSNENTPSAILSAQAELERIFPDIIFSRLTRTAPVDFVSPRLFYNCVAACTTARSLTEVHDLLKQIEAALGRKPEDKACGIVRIDLDLLSYDGEILKPMDWGRTYVEEGRKELEHLKFIR